MTAQAKLLVIELVIPQAGEPNFGKWLDLHMLVITPGARERTANENRTLFHAAGFQPASMIHIVAGPSVLEGIPI
jgi:hypothetical protein